MMGQTKAPVTGAARASLARETGAVVRPVVRCGYPQVKVRKDAVGPQSPLFCLT